MVFRFVLRAHTGVCYVWCVLCVVCVMRGACCVWCVLCVVRVVRMLVIKIKI